MRKELDDQLCAKYPKIFAKRNDSMMETCMCWGFECGDGWYNILDQLCATIQHHIDWQNRKEEKVPQVVAEQVKEKFGTLRFYYTGGDDEIRGMVRMAESMTAVTCEECGSPGTMNSHGWISTRCEQHRSKDNYDIFEDEELRREEIRASGLEE
jgi:hypothetical protein